MPSPDELTAAAERLRLKRPSQSERYSIASMLDDIADRIPKTGMDAPKPKRAKSKTIEDAVKGLDDEPVEESGDA